MNRQGAAEKLKLDAEYHLDELTSDNAVKVRENEVLKATSDDSSASDADRQEARSNLERNNAKISENNFSRRQYEKKLEGLKNQHAKAVKALEMDSKAVPFSEVEYHASLQKKYKPLVEAATEKKTAALEDLTAKRKKVLELEKSINNLTGDERKAKEREIKEAKGNEEIADKKEKLANLELEQAQEKKRWKGQNCRPGVG